jgi:Mono-functional DNA-alkylating methyl methanesulfonate N-term
VNISAEADCYIYRYDSYLLLSLFTQSKLVNLLEDAQFEEVPIQDFPGFSRAAPTLAVQQVNIPEGSLTSLVVQVLPNAALLIDMNSRRKVDEWQAPITLASCNQTAICLVLSTSEFVDLRVDHRTKRFHVK